MYYCLIKIEILLYFFIIIFVCSRQSAENFAKLVLLLIVQGLAALSAVHQQSVLYIANAASDSFKICMTVCD